MPLRLVRPGLTRILKTYPLLGISYSSTQRAAPQVLELSVEPGARRSHRALAGSPRGALTTADNACLTSAGDLASTRR